MPTYLLTIAYEGTHYAGWQRQKGHDSVQARLEEALAAIDCPGIHVEGAGRTDSGVHAFGQCAHVALPRRFPPGQLHLAINAHLPLDIAVQSVREVPDAFHARFCARGKRYIYRCVVTPVRPAIGRDLCFWIRRSVDLAAMREAAQCLRGTHNFVSFATTTSYPRWRPPVRTLQHVHLRRHPYGFDFAVQGSGFLYNMVRTIVGSLLEVGYGNREPGWIAEVLASQKRRNAGPTAPASGLYLARVLYAPDWTPGAEPGSEADGEDVED